MVIPPNAQGGILEGTSLGPAGGCSAMHCLFRGQSRGGGGGVGFLPWGSYCCIARQVSGRKRSIVIALLLTISSSPVLDSASKEFTDLVVAGSAA